MIYRREIDGLRALAVLPVILFHAGFRTFSGGFVGVDVFFVISGYLIASIIMAELNAGTFSLVRFYERRARRILPALFVVLLACLPFAWIWLLPQDLKAFSQSLVAVATFLSNILFWHQSGYFDTAAELKPLVHTWSLALEEQFYLFLPLLLMFAWPWGRRRILTLLGVLFILSLTEAQLQLWTAAGGAFFSLQTRCWELLLGVFAAFFLAAGKNEKVPALINEAGATAGLAMIAWAVFAFDRHTVHPGLPTLIPTIGAMLVILCASPHTMAGKLLGNRLLVGIGLISYSAYLWHQPLFAFAKYRMVFSPDQWLLGLLAVPAFLLAWFSWKFVETPFRNASVHCGRRILVLALGGGLFFITVGLVGHHQDGFENRLSGRFQDYSSWKKPFEPDTTNAHCNAGGTRRGWQILPCKLGDVTAQPLPEIAFLGDSHSNAINGGLDALARSMKRSFVQLSLAGCPPLLGVGTSGLEKGLCENSTRRQFEYIKASGIKHVVLVARWSLYTDGEPDPGKPPFFLTSAANGEPSLANSRKVFAEGMAATLGAYRAIGVKVSVLLQVPQQKIVPEVFYAKVAYLQGTGNTAEASAAVSQASIGMTSHLQLHSHNRSVIERLGREHDAVVLNPDVYFCDRDLCAIGDSTRSYYRDRDHLNAYGTALMAPLLRTLLQ